MFSFQINAVTVRKDVVSVEKHVIQSLSLSSQLFNHLMLRLLLWLCFGIIIKKKREKNNC